MDTCQNKETRDCYFDILKGICIFLVLAGHVIQYIIYANDKAFFEDVYFKSIYGFHMPLFMMICGYFTSVSIEKKGYFVFVKKRILAISRPIILFCVVPVILKQIVNQNVNIYSALLSVSELWFLWVTVALSISVAFLKQKLDFLSICCAVLACVVLSLPARSLFFFMLPYFICGMYLNKSRIDILSRNKSIVLNLFSYMVLIMLFNEQTYIYTSGINPISSSNGFCGQIIIDIHRFLSGFVGSFALMGLVNRLCVMTYKNKFLNFAKDVLAYLGVLSLQIYVLQHFILEKVAFSFWRKMNILLGGESVYWSLPNN